MKYVRILIAFAIAFAAMLVATSSHAQDIREVIDTKTGSLYIITSGNVTPDVIVTRYDGVYRKALKDAGELEEGEHLTPEKLYRAEGNSAKIIPVCLDERGLAKNFGSPGDEGVWRTCSGKPSMVFIPGQRYLVPTQKMVSYEAAKSLFLGIRKCFKGNDCTLLKVADIAKASGIVITTLPKSTDSSGEIAALEQQLKDAQTVNAALTTDLATARDERDEARRTNGHDQVDGLKTQIATLTTQLATATSEVNRRFTRETFAIVLLLSTCAVGLLCYVGGRSDGRKGERKRQAKATNIDPRTAPTMKSKPRPGEKPRERTPAPEPTRTEAIWGKEAESAPRARRDDPEMTGPADPLPEPTRPNAGLAKTVDQTSTTDATALGAEAEDRIRSQLVESLGEMYLALHAKEHARLTSLLETAVGRATAAEGELSGAKARITDFEQREATCKARVQELEGQLAAQATALAEVHSFRDTAVQDLMTAQAAVESERANACVKPDSHRAIDGLRELYRKVENAQSLMASCHDDTRSALRKRFPVSDGSNDSDPHATYADAVSELDKANQAFASGVAELIGKDGGEYALLFDAVFAALHAPTPKRSPSVRPPAPAPATTVAKNDTAPPASEPFHEGEYEEPPSAGHQVAPRATPLPVISNPDGTPAAEAAPPDGDPAADPPARDTGVGLSDAELRALELENQAFGPPKPPANPPHRPTNPYSPAPPRLTAQLGQDPESARKLAELQSKLAGKNGGSAESQKKTLAPPDLTVLQSSIGGSPLQPVTPTSEPSEAPPAAPAARPSEKKTLPPRYGL